MPRSKLTEACYKCREAGTHGLRAQLVSSSFFRHFDALRTKLSSSINSGAIFPERSTTPSKNSLCLSVLNTGRMSLQLLTTIKSLQILVAMSMGGYPCKLWTINCSHTSEEDDPIRSSSSHEIHGQGRHCSCTESRKGDKMFM